jgi:3-oxoacyl-[acyl-carrier-protein] synthase III
MRAGIVGSGGSLPEIVVAAAHPQAPSPATAGRVVRRAGVRERRRPERFDT